MTREIKFAFWHKQKKEMWSAQSIDWDAREVCNGGDIASLDDGILLQYTGLEDKNGKEMYEGDLVQCYDRIGVLIGTIEYRLSSFVAVCTTTISRKCSCCRTAATTTTSSSVAIRHNEAQSISLESQDLEIIGNIYENPELLNKGE